MKKYELHLSLQILCGDICKTTCDVVVHINTNKRSKIPEEERSSDITVKPAHQKGVKFYFHLHMEDGCSNKHWEQMVVKCIQEANIRECEDVAFDIDRVGEDPSKMATIFEKAMDLLEYCEFSNKTEINVRMVQVYSSNTYYFDILANRIVRMASTDEDDVNCWRVNTYSIGDFKYDELYDEYWSRLSKCDDSSLLPDDWEELHTEETRKLVKLKKSSCIYSDLTENFNTETGGKYQIIKIEQVQIPMVYKMYTMYTDSVEDEVGRHHGEQMLWHGCAPDAAKSICQSGFHVSHCGENGACYYGSGIYFAKEARRPAALYSRPEPRSGKQYIFWCKVAVGDYARGEKGYSEPPLKPSATHTESLAPQFRPSPEGTQVEPNGPDYNGAVRPRDTPPTTTRYHSVVDNVEDPSLFVVFKDYAAYPEYLITFKEK